MSNLVKHAHLPLRAHAALTWVTLVLCIAGLAGHFLADGLCPETSKAPCALVSDSISIQHSNNHEDNSAASPQYSVIPTVGEPVSPLPFSALKSLVRLALPALPPPRPA